MNPEYVKFRTIEITGDMATTDFQIGLLRPGEGIILGDVLILDDPSLKASGSTKSSDVRRLAFPARLKEQLDLFDVLRAQAFANSPKLNHIQLS